MAECACASLIFTSFTDVPSLVCVEPKYLNWSTSSSVCPFICMLVDGLGLMVLTRIFLALAGADFHFHSIPFQFPHPTYETVYRPGFEIRIRSTHLKKSN